MESPETLRRGVYYTPQPWVEAAHRVLEDTLGATWRDDCLVWDSACGTGNLTREYAFRNLLQSTLEHEDVAAIRARDPQACVFQYDFLNDEEHPFIAGGNVVPTEVRERLEVAAKAGKRLVFLINPPYVDAGPMGISGHETKAGAAATYVSSQMAGLGRAVRQTYTQFLYRIAQIREEYGFKHITVAVFCKPVFLCSGGYHKFRHFWFERFKYEQGFMFQANHFPGVSNGAWAVSFTLWSEGSTPLDAPLLLRLKDLKDGVVQDIGEKSLYSAVGREASRWVRQPTEGLASEPTLAMTSGLKPQPFKDAMGTPGALAYLAANGNSLTTSYNKVYFLSYPPPSSTGITTIPIFSHNFKRVCAYYAARKVVAGNWVNDKDEYLTPVEGEGFSEWVDNAVVYAAFHWANNCSSLPDVTVGNKTYEIRNPFYWRPSSDGSQAHMAEILPTLNLWSEARAVVDIADELLDLGQKHRWEFDPQYHLERWDAGVYQLKFLWRKHLESLWDDFQEAIRNLGVRLAPGVYQYGFLR